MAVWQIEIEMIPRDYAISINYETKSLQCEQFGYDESRSWVKASDSSSFIDTFSQLLPQKKESYTDRLCFGDGELHDITISLESGNIKGINVRLHVGKMTNNILDNLVLGAQKHDCVLFIPELDTIIRPSSHALINVIYQSNAFQFVEEPRNFIDKISSGKISVVEDNLVQNFIK